MLVSYDDNSDDDEATGVETSSSIPTKTTPANNISHQTNQTKRVITLTLNPLPKSYQDHDDNDSNRPLSMNAPIAKNATLTSILPPPKKSNLSTSNTSNSTNTNTKSQLSNDTTTKQTSRIILPKQIQPQTTTTTTTTTQHPQNPKVRIVQSNTTSNGRILPPQLRKFIESTGVKTSASDENLVNSAIQYPVNTQSTQPQHATTEKNQPIPQEDNEEEEEESFFTFETPDYSKFAIPETIQYPNTTTHSQNTSDETSEENTDQTQPHEIQKQPVEIQPDFGPALPNQEPLYSYNDYYPTNTPHPYLPTQYNEYTATIPQWEQSKTFKTRGVTDFIEVTQQDQLRDAHSFQKMSVSEQAAQQSALSVLASGIKPTTQQKRKHQLTYLAFEAKQKELLLAERKASSKKTKAETRAKYIW